MQLINRITDALDDRTMNEKLALALLVPIIFWVWGATIHTGHAYAVIIAGALLVFMMLPSIPLKVFGFYLAVYTAWIFSSACAKLMPGEILGQTSDSVLLIMAAAVYFLIIYHGKMEIEKYASWICSVTLVLAVMGIAMYYLKNLPAVAFLGNQNFLAAWLAIAFPFFIRQGEYRYFVKPRFYFPRSWWGRFFDHKITMWAVCVPILLLTFYLCQTTTAFVAAMAGTAYSLWPQIRAAKLKISIPICAVIGGVVIYYAFIYHPFIRSPRFGYWKDLLLDLSSGWHFSNSWPFVTVTTGWHYLFFGVGPGVLWRVGDMLHSEYAYGMFYFGIVGLVFYAAIIATVPRSNRTLYASFIAIIVDMIGNHLFHTAPTAILSIIPVALLFRIDREHRKARGMKESKFGFNLRRPSWLGGIK